MGLVEQLIDTSYINCKTAPQILPSISEFMLQASYKLKTPSHPEYVSFSAKIYNTTQWEIFRATIDRYPFLVILYSIQGNQGGPGPAEHYEFTCISLDGALSAN